MKFVWSSNRYAIRVEVKSDNSYVRVSKEFVGFVADDPADDPSGPVMISCPGYGRMTIEFTEGFSELLAEAVSLAKTIDEDGTLYHVVGVSNAGTPFEVDMWAISETAIRDQLLSAHDVRSVMLK